MSTMEERAKRLAQVQRAHGDRFHVDHIIRDTLADEESPWRSGVFTWDKDAAQWKCWRDEARGEIRRIKVTFNVGSGEPIECRAYISLSEDRAQGGGYRSTVNVMNQSDLRAIAVRDAFAEMTRFRRKYAHLSELAEVFDAMDRVAARIEPVEDEIEVA